MFLQWEKPGLCQSISNGEGRQRARRNPNRSCDQGFQMANSLHQAYWRAYWRHVLSEALLAVSSSHAQLCVTRITAGLGNGNWKCQKAKGVFGRCHWGEHLWCLQYKKKKKPTMIDLKMGRVISKMEMDEKRRKRKGKSRAKTRRKSYFFSFKGHWDIGNLAPFI